MKELIAQGPVDVNVRHCGCLLCAWGNDLPEGEHCRACGCGLSAPATSAKPASVKEGIAQAAPAPAPAAWEDDGIPF